MQTYSVGELAKAVTGGNQRQMRKLLNDAGARLDEQREDPEERVSRDLVVGLFAQRAGDSVGRRLSKVLRTQ